MHLLKSIAVLVIGYYAIGTVVGIFDSGLQTIFPQSLPNQMTGQLPDLGWLGFHVLEVGLITVASAYCVATMVPGNELLHVSILGAWMVLVGIQTAIDFAGRWPIWFSASMATVPVPAIYLGGYLALKQRQVHNQKSRDPLARHIVMRTVLWGIGLAILLAAHHYQNDSFYRRHFSMRDMFWFGELPCLVIIGACLGYVVGKWRERNPAPAPPGSTAASGA